ncbi:hypothetical protein LTR93_012247, partial [Exophiala xenobiotica]
MANAEAIGLLQELQDSIDSIRGQTIDDTTYFALVGRLSAALRDLQNTKHREEGEKRENGTQIFTRRDASSQESQQNRVVRDANKEKPGNVTSTKSNRSYSAKPSPRQNLSRSRTPAARIQESKENGERGPTGVIFQVNRRSDWDALQRLTPDQLRQAVKDKAGKEIAERIRSFKFARGGRMWITPIKEFAFDRKFRDDTKWIRKWIPFATMEKQAWKVLVMGLPSLGHAESVAKAIQEENAREHDNLDIIGAEWMGGSKRKSRPLILTVRSAELADELIVYGIALNMRSYTVRRFVSNPEKRYNYEPLYNVDGIHSPMGKRDFEFDTPSEYITESDAIQGDEEPEETSLPKKLRTDEGARPKRPRGRPVGSLNKSKFAAGGTLGDDPFQGKITDSMMES